MTNKHIKIFSNLDDLSQAAAEYFISLAAKSIRKRGYFSVALSGGGTPKPLYKALGSPDQQSRLDWKNIHLFWGDERCVPPEHPDSNYRMVREEMLSNITIAAENINRVPAELEAHKAAFSYEEKLRGFFQGEWPRFDLVLLGMGDDGHTASLFPHSAGLNEEQRWFIANYAPEPDTWRLTLTKNAINAARHIAVIVAGDSKAEVLADVLEGVYQPDVTPIQLIGPKNGHMIWFLDQAAAKKLVDPEKP
ncbi:MAG: 6-phosphogluconolactonase [Chloroflexota bacterium]|nr:6-phosphogluconolactonase [Chloroflexota bacterium]